MHVNGLPLPAALISAASAGQWPPTASVKRFNEVFPDEAEWPRFYSLEEIEAVNRGWRNESREMFIGKRGAPGSIRPEESLLIGELGPDQLVALEYRSEGCEPIIVYLSDNMTRPWVKVASDLDELIDLLTDDS